MKTQLLCTFTTKRKVATTILQIKDRHEILYDKIYILTTNNKDNPSELICSYNIVPDPKVKFLSKTISVHRKTETNTLYTINALNQLIKDINNGILDTSYQVKWENYRNCLLITDHLGLKKVLTRVYDIVNLK